ncbi:hypothetical protein [Gallaecimonas sp. GXIMD4217]|uniref:hypothetical protein n=1 Tax=Gallaecimonas sp. GXIMD4217 TaxID=3131927 RepID=UPI00311AF6F7
MSCTLVALGLTGFCQAQELEFIPQAPTTIALWQGDLPGTEQDEPLLASKPKLSLTLSSRQDPFLRDLGVSYRLSERARLTLGGRVEDGLTLQAMPMETHLPRELQKQSFKGFVYASFEFRF